MRLHYKTGDLFTSKEQEITTLLSLGRKKNEMAFLVLADYRKFDLRPYHLCYLTTKSLSSNKPTYQRFTSSIHELRRQIDSNDIRSIGIPLLACSTHGLVWSRVLPIIEQVFENHDIDIVVYYLPSDAHLLEL